MTTPVLRLGLVGAGRIGQVHAASIAADPGTALALVHDPVPGAAAAVVARHGGTAVELDAVFAPGAVDAVVVATPTATHVELILRCVDAGLPVLCEKPIDLDLARVDAVRDRVRASGVPVAIGFNRRFDPAFAELRARVGAGEIGTLEQLSITSRDPAPPPPGYVAGSGGIFRDMTIHDLDMARFFLPDVVEVSATAAALFDADIAAAGDFDTAVVVLRSASGPITTITNSRHSAPGYDQRLEAFGSTGVLQVGNAGTSLVSLSTATAVEARPPYQNFFLQRYAAAYAAELAAFASWVRGGPATCPTFEDGRAALVLADAAQRSATGRTVVHLDPT